MRCSVATHGHSYEFLKNIYRTWVLPPSTSPLFCVRHVAKLISKHPSPSRLPHLPYYFSSIFCRCLIQYRASRSSSRPWPINGERDAAIEIRQAGYPLPCHGLAASASQPSRSRERGWPTALAKTAVTFRREGPKRWRALDWLIFFFLDLFLLEDRLICYSAPLLTWMGGLILFGTIPAQSIWPKLHILLAARQTSSETGFGNWHVQRFH